MRRIIVYCVLVMFFAIETVAQDSLAICDIQKSDTVNPYKFNVWRVAVPSTLIGVGVVGLESHWLKNKITRLEMGYRKVATRKLVLTVTCIF